MFRFSVMESWFCFTNVDLINVPASQQRVREVQAILAWKERLDTTCGLEN